MRTRKAHIRIVDDTGRHWRLTWCPKDAVLRGRRKSDRTTFEITSSQLITFIRLRGAVKGKPLPHDLAQLSFA